MATKTRYQAWTEERAGMPLQQFVYGLRCQIAEGKATWDEVSEQTGIPKQTLRNWSERLLVVKEVVEIRDPSDDTR